MTTFSRKYRSLRNLPCGDQLFQVAVGGRDDPHVDADRLVVADARDLCSSSTRSSLICVAIGMSPTSSRNSVPPLAYSNLPMRSLMRVGERALHVAEQLAFEQVLGHRGAVEGDERLALCAGCFDEWPGRPAPCRCRFRR